MKFFKNITIYIIIITVILTVGVYYGLTTTLGSKILLKFLNKSYRNKYVNKININLNKLSGNIIHGLVLKEINYLDDNYDIQIDHVNIKINLLHYLFKKKIKININQLSGNLNKQSIIAAINLEINHQHIKLKGSNFIKIGNNLLKLSNAYNSNNSNLKQIDFKLNLEQISLLFPKISGNLHVSGGVSNKLDNLTAKIHSNQLIINNKNYAGLLASKNNHLEVEILFKPKPIIIIDVNFIDLNGIMDFIPEISRLTGKLQGRTKINFNSFPPAITTDLKAKDISVTLPTYGIKIKPLNINFLTNNNTFIDLDAKGFMRNGQGSFKVQGKINPFDLNNPFNLKITSNDLEFINTPEYHLMGKLNLKLSLLNQNLLHISGDINIPKGLINLEKQHSRIVKSKDIILINPDSNFKNNDISRTSSNGFKISSDIDLRIEENTRLIGIGLNANITGKLKIYTLKTDYDNWLGDGRITIKKGIYILSNQKFLIDKGRMIYLPGTLINNPILDIKILANQEHFAKKSNEKYLYIEGTLEKPVIRNLGLIDEKQAILQILNLGNNPLSGSIKEKFNLTEFGIQDNHYETSNEFNEFKEFNQQQSFLENKHFVIGKKISKKVDFKYFRTLNTANNILKLKYYFHPNFAFEIESSTLDGYGSDFIFYKEIQ